MSKVLAIASGLLGGIVAAGATFAIMQPNKGGDSSALALENGALRSRVDDLEKKLGQLDTRIQNQSTAFAQSSVREAAPMPKDAASQPTADLAATVVPADRDKIFALIKEERDLRDKERQDKQKQQIRDNLTRRVQSAADRAGLDPASKDALVRMYMDNLSREEEIRKAYPVDYNNQNDPNMEKRRAEIDAARKDLEARADAMIPADKKDEWDRSTRFLNRTGDFAEAIQAGPDNMMGMFGGRGGFGGFGGGPPGGGTGGPPDAGGNNNNGGGRGGRGNRGGGGGRNGGGAAAPAAPAQDTGK